MSSPGDVSDRTRRRLEQLQAEIEDATGREVSRRQVLDRLVDEGHDSKDALIASFQDEMSVGPDDDWEGLSEEEREAFLSGTFASGKRTDEADIDEILYG